MSCQRVKEWLLKAAWYTAFIPPAVCCMVFAALTIVFGSIAYTIGRVVDIGFDAEIKRER